MVFAVNNTMAVMYGHPMILERVSRRISGSHDQAV